MDGVHKILPKTLRQHAIPIYMLCVGEPVRPFSDGHRVKPDNDLHVLALAVET